MKDKDETNEKKRRRLSSYFVDDYSMRTTLEDEDLDRWRGEKKRNTEITLKNCFVFELVRINDD